MTTLKRLATSWKLALEAAHKSPRTIETYLDSLDRFTAHLGDDTIDVADIDRTHVEAFIKDQLDRHSPATASVRYRSLRAFFNWAVRDDEIDRSPMANTTPPTIPDKPVPVVTEDEMRRLLKTCTGKTFEDRRDNAILRLMYDTGCRLAEVSGLQLGDIDLDLRVIRVIGKGRRPRAVPFGAATARAIDRYLRLRDSHALAERPDLWLGTSSRTFGPHGLRQMVERRGNEAGIKSLHPHRFRHSFAHQFLSDGGNESDLMMLTGWRSRQMLNRYAASTAAERARTNYRSPGDRL